MMIAHSFSSVATGNLPQVAETAEFNNSVPDGLLNRSIWETSLETFLGKGRHVWKPSASQ